jgi:hypothetical protein
MRTDRSRFFSPAMWGKVRWLSYRMTAGCDNFRSSLLQYPAVYLQPHCPYFPGRNHIRAWLKSGKKAPVPKPQPAVPSLLPPSLPTSIKLICSEAKPFGQLGFCNSSVDGRPMALGRAAHWLVFSKAGQQHHAHFHNRAPNPTRVT